MRRGFIVLALVAFTFCGCSSWIRDLSDLVHSTPGVVDSLGQRLGGGLVQGARDTLTNEESKRKLASLLDVVTAHIDSGLARGGTTLRDSLLGEYTKAWLLNLKDELLGAKTREQLAAVRDELLGPKTQALVQHLVQENLLGPGTTERVNALVRQGVLDPLKSTVDDILYKLRTEEAPGLRDTLIGPKTAAYIDSILTRSLMRVDTALQRANATAKDQEGFLKKNITTILWTAGGIILLLMAAGTWIFVRAYRARKIIDVLTYQIHDYTSKTGDTTLTENIKAESKRVGTEGYLRPLLVKKGLVKPQSPGSAG
ncbi:MAG: hypothetical protein JST22_15155 [Bacteroidetes bacterium]|nr:hypothetical protein [Bacteroidota bacterium]